MPDFDRLNQPHPYGCFIKHPYIPNTEADRQRMLKTIGVKSVDDLFYDVPAGHRYPKLDLPPALSEMEVRAELQALADRNADLGHYACFLGAGAYHHYIPSTVNVVLSRGEFYTAYTPYQPEVSQGTLQTIFEYQSMICLLTDMDVANASHYDGATALAEAVLMAAAATGRHQVVISPFVHPEYRTVIRTYAPTVTLLGDHTQDPIPNLHQLVTMVDSNTAALVLQTPNFLGELADLTGVADRVHAAGALLLLAVDPISLGLFKSPGEWGADIVAAEGQPLGNAISFGGPYLGILACKAKYLRRLPGRLIGQTKDNRGQRGFVLTLQTREQHIRREKATSNICSNQALCALAAGVYLATLGKTGLRQVAELCYQKAHYAAAQISKLPGYRLVTTAPFFKEFVIETPIPPADLNRRLLARKIIGGYDLGTAYPALKNHMLLCVTEMNTKPQIDTLVAALAEVGR